MWRKSQSDTYEQPNAALFFGKQYKKLYPTLNIWNLLRVCAERWSNLSVKSFWKEDNCKQIQAKRKQHYCVPTSITIPYPLTCSKLKSRFFTRKFIRTWSEWMAKVKITVEKAKGLGTNKHKLY